VRLHRALRRAVVAALAALALPAGAHADVGPYLDIASWQRIGDHTVMGPEGVPQVRYHWGIEDNPVTVSQWGLQHWTWWTATRRQPDLEAARRAADWLLAHQRDDGAWEYTFKFNGAGVNLQAPWISGMAQGQAISLLVRVHHQTGDQRYIDAAELALAPLEKTVADGGVVADWDGLKWYEEYPTADSQHVLNGFEFTLIGLDDLRDRSPRAQQLWEHGVVSLVAHIGAFDAPAAHNQYYAARGAGRVLVTGSYPRIHAVLTRAIARISGDPTLAAWAARWEGYLTYRPPPPPPPPSPPPPPPPSPPPDDPVTKPKPCHLTGKPLRTRGPISCRRARRVVSRYLRRHRSPRRWRCRTGKRVICRRGTLRVSAARPQRRASRTAPRYASSSSSAQRAQV
jgi:heparosan-N-sulfate-glucuronate 5-epimerase